MRYWIKYTENSNTVKTGYFATIKERLAFYYTLVQNGGELVGFGVTND